MYLALPEGTFFVTDPSSLGNAPYRGIVNSNIDLFNMMGAINSKAAIGFQIKHRTIVNVDHISQELLTLAVKELEYSSLWNTSLTDKQLNISMNSWMEFNFNYAQIVKDDGEHFLKTGGKLKLLKGVGSFYLYGDEISYDFSSDSVANLINGDFSYGYSANAAVALNKSSKIGDVPSLLEPGMGLGLDIGMVYEWRPDWAKYKYDMDGETNLWMKDKNKYKLRASLAINDIGSMKYNKAESSRDFTANVTNFDMGPFTSVQGLESFDNVVTDLVADTATDFAYSQGQLQSFYRMNLPTHINAAVDYHIWNDFYVDLRSVIAFQRNGDQTKVRYPSSVAVTPRFDHKYFGVSLPLSYSGMFGFRAGIALRAGPLFIGFADMKPLFAPGKDTEIRGAGVYAGVRLWMLNKAPKDQDEDLVSKKYDECPDVAGLWEYLGCPDTDGDGIKDSDDACPLDSGIVKFRGCPDSDGDGIKDNEDDCPEVKGSREFNGCPDTDKDGIIDKDDLCPKVAGLLAFSGCPDTDGDGLSDAEDLCPNDAGPKANEGCPDTDKDGLFDYLDQCPDKAGPEENRGCPYPDTDGDGLLDKDDDCPNNAGPKSNKGCPLKDTDGDGVLDKDDDCVNTPGAKSNNGCPLIQEEEQEIINTAFEALEFQSGKDIIKEISHPSLEELAMLLLRKSDWKLIIAGHTDNVGNDKTNLILSKKRSTAVAVFLEHRGVKMDRLIIQYYGEEKPIDSNDTKEGRQKNRRVEMTVLFE
jgi:outer membrane protein OmpA-like peptidoglycan-associated protein